MHSLAPEERKMIATTLEEFRSKLLSEEPISLTRLYVDRVDPPALAGRSYETLLADVRSFWPTAERAIINGSGCWGWSLSPDAGKFLLPFRPESDIDLAVVSPADFNVFWERLRAYQRQRWYELTHATRDALLRAGQDIYSGFFNDSPYLPAEFRAQLFSLNVARQTLSGGFGQRTVNVRFYKNFDEVVDYCLRGFSLARRRLTS